MRKKSMRKISIVETYQREIFVDAETDDEAVEIARKALLNRDIVLGDSDYIGSNIEVVADEVEPNICDPAETDNVFGKNGRLKLFDVTIARTGCAYVFAENDEAALKVANTLPETEISWSDDFKATDANRA